MKFVRVAAISTLAVLAALQSAGSASADHRLRMRVLWPKIYAPHVSGYLYRHDDEDADFFDLEDEEEMLPRRRHRDRNVILQYDDEEDDWLEPQYEPPVKKKVKPKAKKKVVAKKPAASKTQAAAVVVKPKVKPAGKLAAVATPVKATGSNSVVAAKTPVTTTVVKANPALPSASAVVVKSVPQTVAPKSPAVPVKAAVAAPAAKAAAPAGSIACSKGAEIVSGYGFTSVKPRTCTGSTYSFDATRAANAYLIKVAAASGEITDVQKLK